MAKKLGRNAPCWCGSGQKYKYCHLNRQSQQRIQPWEAERELRRAFSSKTCSVPASWHSECTGSIVRAHTIPKSLSLKSIARDGHIYGYFLTFAKLTQHNGKVPPELIGINRASTFTGFCAKHDTGLFAPVETRTFASTPEQCFLLAYRALAREIYTKNANADLSEVRKDADKGRSESDQLSIQMQSLLFDVGIGAGQRDNLRHLAEMNACLAAGDYSTTRAYIVELGEPPPVMCSGGIFPGETFDGVQLHDLSDPEDHADLLTISSFYDGAKGYIVLAWLEGSDKRCIPFVDSLRAISTEELASALIRMIFEYLENTFMAPEWWEALTDVQRESLNNRMWGLVDQLMTGKETGNIQEDGVSFPPWNVVSRKLVGDHCANNAIQPTGENASG